MSEKRAFTDREGVRWSVTEVAPLQSVAPTRERRKLPRMAKRAAPTRIGFQTRDLLLPWLRFESRADVRAIEPAPQQWATLSDAELEDLLGRSARVKG